jgi:hypothetical protein
MNSILIFKTDIQTQTDKLKIKSVLDTHPLIKEWNVDLEDIDCVLRIVSPGMKVSQVTELIEECGYHCSELD